MDSNSGSTDTDGKIHKNSHREQIAENESTRDSYPIENEPSEEVCGVDERNEGNTNTYVTLSSGKLNQNKRKRIHMDSKDCFQRAESCEGAVSLKDPHVFSNSVQKARQLLPVHRNKKQRINTDNGQKSEGVSGQEVHGNPSLNLESGFPSRHQSGFVSASDMYKLHVDKPVLSSVNNGFSLSKHVTTDNDASKKGKFKQIGNQGSITNFFKSKSISSYEDAKVKTEDDPYDVLPGSQGSSRSVMYSPIKPMENSQTIYISDSSPCSSPASSQTRSSQKLNPDTSNQANSVVKKLFDGQRNLNKAYKTKKSTKGSKARQKSTATSKIDVKKEVDNIINADSFDLDQALSGSMDEEWGEGVKKETVSDKYGLLGSGSYPKQECQEKINYFERLPPEVLETIFCQLPMLDLCLNSNRVCLQWNDIIADEKFVPWKKLYHKLKKNVGSSRRDVQNIMTKNGMTRPANYLLGLIMYMKNFKPVTASNMLQCLQRHSKYQWAKALIEERAQDCIVNQEPNPWCVITTLVIISHDVYDIEEIIHWLTIPTSHCTSKEVIECLYCVATLLYAFKLVKKGDVWNGMHYRLFYALYLFENTSTSSCADLQSVTSSSKGQQSLVKYSVSSDNVRLTHEQLRIVKHQTRADEIIKIVAFAGILKDIISLISGTGKTTTLVRYTQLRPDKKFLLVVYNKSVCNYAETKFPRNVTCKTGHALAFAQVGRRYAAAKKLRDVKVYGITQALPPRKGENLYVRAKNVLTTIENYLSSADDEITIDHTPDYRMNERNGLKELIPDQYKVHYVEEANFIWRKMKDFNEKRIGMSHDGYLKLFQLSRPSLSSYDCILIDEAQDLTPAITHILLNQPQGKILVGDPHQQIYSFRGAVNAMDSITADTIFYLTQSFRFGPEIAQVAASCLEILKKEDKKTLVGSGKKCVINGDKVGQLAIISRANFTVFSEAVKKCCFSDEDCKVAFVGGTHNFGFPMLMDIYYLRLPENERIKDGYVITHPLIKMFKSFSDLQNFAAKAMDKELEGKIKIVNTYGNNLPVFIRKIESKCVNCERHADYVFSTAHKAKGLEFSTVRVTDDFNVDKNQGPATVMLDMFMGAMFGEDFIEEMVQNRPAFREEPTDEENLLYVAVTRAKNALQMSPTVMKVLKYAGENFDFPSLSEGLRLSGVTFKCSETDEEFKPKALTLQRKTVKLGDGTSVGGQMFSPALLSEDMGSYSQLLGLTKNDSKDVKKKSNMVNVDAFYGNL